MLAFMKTNSGFNAFIDGSPYCVNSDHQNYDKLVEAIRENDVDKFLSLIDVKKSVEKYSNGVCTIDENNVYINGQVVHSNLASKIMEMKREGFPFDFMLRFLEKIQQNPSAQSRLELYDFIQNKGVHITTEGDILCYKIVRNDYYSKTAGDTKLIKGTVNDEGRIYNGIGEEIECERGVVDDDRRQECSFGLHVGGSDYAGPNGFFRNNNSERCILVCVNPKDCVSVPLDHNANKLRVCAYKVVKEVEEQLSRVCYNNDSSDVVINKYDDDEYEDEYDEYEDDDENEFYDNEIEDLSDLLVGDVIQFKVNSVNHIGKFVDVGDKFIVVEEDGFNQYQLYNVDDVCEVRLL